MTSNSRTRTSSGPISDGPVILIVGGTGKGRSRVAARLPDRRVPVRIHHGRNAHLADGVERALGRPASDVADHVRVSTQTAVWV